MKYLFFDTETTGPVPARARLVQLAWLLASEDGTTLLERSVIIQPRGFVIPAESTAIHGIAHLQAVTEGILFNEAMYRFNNSLIICDALVAHNFMYDITVLCAEIERAKMFENARVLGDKPAICTMKGSMDYCQLADPKKKRGYKRPRLTELHQHLFGKGFDGAHDALNDVRATAR